MLYLPNKGSLVKAYQACSLNRIIRLTMVRLQNLQTYKAVPVERGHWQLC